ncbi:urea ABC transporter ATP-binding protein UrtD [Paenibacillus sp. FSL H7-0326]|uniref:urea ABC transporter ATP-binding protein UrtD n=1 Tax=Paenibacillus sp. FSL H7-0326 TaxID=1921144 RepID=UPI00096CE819|nr:urea ABC transporter ATP-binding protein UrtD [Paenibacillus sp. FSL H7-0326]OMC71423.1 urea ABC transporter ATP-binding protein UrtD [Paenibacillus sp. FSL H7-0326]
MSKILETNGLTVEFSGFSAISDLHFSLNRGELRVVLGPNGAGKTTLMDLITGKTKPKSGNIMFNGNDITGMEPFDISKLGVGRKFQGPNIFDNMTVIENIEVAFKGNHSVLKALFFKKNSEMKDRINYVLDKINLKIKYRDIAGNLSHGEKQWLEMGMLLVQDPELIILDEPTAGMTAEETYQTGELIQNLFKDRSVIVVEHDMAFVRQVAQYVTVLHQGRLLAEGTLEEIENNTKVQEVYLKEGAHA